MVLLLGDSAVSCGLQSESELAKFFLHFSFLGEACFQLGLAEVGATRSGIGDE